MIFRIFIFLFLTTSLFSADNTDSWYSKIDTKVEAGMFLSNFEGDISNASSTTDFKDDYGYDKTTSSYFSLQFRFDYDYMPNIDISYFNMKQSQNADLNKSFEVAGTDFNGTVSTAIDYKVLNVVLHKEFKTKGDRIVMFGRKFYPGDVEFDIGMNIKSVFYLFQVKDSSDSSAEYEFLGVNSIIPLPYLGIKYYYYNFIGYANISALSFSEAKAMDYQIGIDYRVIDRLYLSASYIYEDFEATAGRDKVYFKTVGNKFSFKYIF
jgi:hypothetical protein